MQKKPKQFICRKNEIEQRKIEQNRLMLLLNCAVCSKKKSRLIKSQEVHEAIVLRKFKMNKIINKFLLTGDKLMPKLHLRQPGFTCSACKPFTKHCERILKIRKTGNFKHLYTNELHKACFAHVPVYSDNYTKLFLLMMLCILIVKI